MSEKNLKLTVVRVGNKYLNASTTKELRITIGQVIEGKKILSYDKEKRQ
ncbi:MAG: hypothetical protein E6845_07590 [Clostridium sp.]|jgi:hypothetical protein|nr:hypothetical protein [Clostridium sp.]MDU1602813.1 hypothetical protein [Clostridium sp.]